MEYVRFLAVLWLNMRHRATTHVGVGSFAVNGSPGQGALPFIFLVGLIAAIVATAIAEYGNSLQTNSATALTFTEAQMFENQLNTILSNDQLCDKMLNISAPTFTVTVPGSPPVSLSTSDQPLLPHITIASPMSAVNVHPVPSYPVGPGYYQADLSVNYSFFDPASNIVIPRTWTGTVIYKPGAGTTVKNCVLASIAKGACTSMGFTWVSSPPPGSCAAGVCGDMGGVWNAAIGICTF